MTIVAYDLLGRPELPLLDASIPAGDHRFQFDLSGLPSGRHFILVRSLGWSVNEPILLDK
jgi:hypothetical protein